MNIRKLLALAAGLFPSVAAAVPADDACTSAYRATIQPIFNVNCVACHQDASPAGGLSLQRTSAPASIVRTPSTESKLLRIAPGDPQKSYLYRKLLGTHAAVGNGDKMPLGGQLSAANLTSVSTWISNCRGR